MNPCVPSVIHNLVTQHYQRSIQEEHSASSIFVEGLRAFQQLYFDKEFNILQVLYTFASEFMTQKAFHRIRL